MLPELLAQIPPDAPMCSVSADGAYDTKACHEAIAGRQAATIIPTRRNVTPLNDGRAGAQARNEILRTTRKLGRTIWKKWSGYHRRSLAETKMGCFKRLGERGDGPRLRSVGHAAIGPCIHPQQVYQPGNA